MLTDSGVTARRASGSFNPSPTRMRLALGDSWMPAPACSSRSAFSSTTTRKPCAASVSDAVSPPIPAPATMTVRVSATELSDERSGDPVLQHAFRRARLAGTKVGCEAIERGAVRADDLAVVAEVEEHVRVVERRVGAHAHELLRADLDHRDAGIVMEVRHDVVGHILTLDGNNGRTRAAACSTVKMPRTILAGTFDS